MKTSLFDLSPVMMVLGGIVLLLASKLAKYIAFALIVLGLLFILTSL